MRELRRFPAQEAHQGVAVDVDHLYTITNRAIGKYEKRTGKAVATWAAPEDSKLRHLNSGVVVDGKLYCAHSNWPAVPLLNSIEVFETTSLAPVDHHLFPGQAGAVTWVDRFRDHWWVGFAHYGNADVVARTTVHKLDDQWKVLGTWTFPREVVERFVPFSNSGASFGPNGLLYATGHDRSEAYAVRFPADGQELVLADTVAVNIAGQGIAWDRHDVGVLYGIHRASKHVVVSRLSHASEYDQLRQPTTWQRQLPAPSLPPGPQGSTDATRCMNPWILRDGDEYRLYYSGGDADGKQRICLATAPVNDLSNWRRHGPLFDVGGPGSFDARWCVLPHVVKVADNNWHLYYTGNAGSGAGLSAFPGIGLATSKDGKTWKRLDGDPILKPTGQPGDPDAIGIAGGSVLSVSLPGGKTEWRFYYTGCPTVGNPLALNQQKTICLATSMDGVRWQRQGAVMLRDPQRDYENIGVAGPVVQQQTDGTFRMWYSAIGTRWGYYSICYAESDDGVHWRRGVKSGDNLQLSPQGTGWERQMVEYPTVIVEGSGLRMFYCGNGYGRTGIGTAFGTPVASQVTNSKSDP
jgi:predicted GH43/DUF377 family glycosyl hydrolase